jgi:hypothetical protein
MTLAVCRRDCKRGPGLVLHGLCGSKYLINIEGLARVIDEN